jgi:hypothetical protein
MRELPLIEYLYRAYNSELGIVLRTNNPDRLRQKLYAERKKDPDLACISINISKTQPESEILLVRKP